MDPIVWLEARILGFRQLPSADRAAISSFLLLWSLFKASALGRNASAHRILALTHEWAARQVLHTDNFGAVLDEDGQAAIAEPKLLDGSTMKIQSRHLTETEQHPPCGKTEHPVHC